MRTRRILLFAALLSISTAFVLALPEPAGVLEVTYYYLPG
jgi:hypothetical protein